MNVTPSRNGEQPAQARDRLLEAVVADGDVFPAGLDQVVLRDNLARTFHQHQQDVELPVGDRDRLAGGGQAASCGKELERLEDEARRGRHV